MKKIIGFELDNIIEDLNQYILIKLKSNIDKFENYIFENPVRFSYL
jgi:predicted ribosome quality control (RQC) complex YloA/Tae2 family protein